LSSTKVASVPMVSKASPDEVDVVRVETVALGQRGDELDDGE
jgi:hypothetical protein